MLGKIENRPDVRRRADYKLAGVEGATASTRQKNIIRQKNAVPSAFQFQKLFTACLEHGMHIAVRDAKLKSGSNKNQHRITPERRISFHAAAFPPQAQHFTFDMRYQGKITDWKDEQGFGFITPNDGGSKVFVHTKSFRNRQRRPEVREIVTYEQTTDPERAKPSRQCRIHRRAYGIH